MLLDTWAKIWGIYPQALADLKRRILAATPPASSGPGVGESEVQNLVRLEASRAGCRLWRNNVGAVVSEDGRSIRYGLLNESKRMNARIKSSDLIGIRPVLIKEKHIGYTIGQFMAREVKRPGWKFTGTDREEAQLKFIKLVIALGGDAKFASGGGTIK
jgi:hypothetical protein